MSSTTSASIIQVLPSPFARMGLPGHVVSDNDPQFVSADFQAFMKSNGMKQAFGASTEQSGSL